MENKDPERVAHRRMVLVVGDYVVYTGEDDYAGFKNGFVYKILIVDKGDIITDDWPYKLSYSPTDIKYWFKSKSLKKATKQEYIVAKLKGRLYE